MATPAPCADAAAEATGDAKAVAGLTVQVTGMSGEPLATVSTADASMNVEGIVALMPEPLPGHEYRIMLGDRVLDVAETLGGLASLGDLRLSAVVTKKETAQADMDLALLGAAEKLDIARVRRLLDAGASAKFLHKPEGVWGSQDNKSALHLALMARAAASERLEDRRAIIEALIAAGADVNARREESDWRGCGSSSTAFELALPEAMRDPALLRLFLDAGASANTTSKQEVHSMRTDGRSVTYVLHRAVQGGSLEVARALLDGGAEVDAVHSERFDNERGFNRHTEETSLHIASMQADVAMANELLVRGAGVDAVRKSLEQVEVKPTREPVTDDPRHPDFEPTVRCVRVEQTALHLAIAARSAALVELLVRHGADVSRPLHRDGEPTWPLELCAGDPELILALKAAAA